ncbi:unnamed protein product, partial [Oppiella nova]
MSKTFRHSTLSKYQIYDISNDSFIDLLPEDPHFESQFIQYIEWGPKDNQIIFVFKNNLYYKADVNTVPIQLTNTGTPNMIYNGYCDWVYEEEILEEEKAFWISPDGQHLVFAKINDTKVDTITWPFYGQYYNLSSNQYPSEVALKYPKPGRNNPLIEIFVLNLNETVENIEIVRLLPPESIAKKDYYFTAIGWIDKDRFSITWLTRAQNHSVIDICDKNSMWNCNTTFTLDSANSWVDLYAAPIPAPGHNSYFIKVPELISSAVGYYHHVAMINIENRKVKYLTKGMFDIIEIVAFNEEEDVVYFLSTLPEKPEFRHLMSVSIHEETVLDPICLTCYLGESCLYNNVFFNSKADYFVLNYSNVELVLPHNFDEKKKYSLMIEVYGGPGSQLVIDKYRVNHWGTHLASNMSIIYARIDSRGSDNRGSKYLHEIYKNLGNVEVMDTIVTARYLRDNLSFIDRHNIGIWGWSYGGYVTLMSLALDYADPVFHCGIAVAPVTNWMFYGKIYKIYLDISRYINSVYVERYMGWPHDNAKAYNRSDLLNKVSLFKDERLLLALGTADGLTG